MSSISDARQKGRSEELRERQQLFKRALSGILILVGLVQWASIVGIAAIGPAPFAELGGAWQLATINLAVAYLVAAVGLWMLTPWGVVIWIYAAASEIAMYTIFAGTFGINLLAIGVQVLLLGGYAVLAVSIRRAEIIEQEGQREERRTRASEHAIGTGRFATAAKERIARTIARRRLPEGGATEATESAPSAQ